MADLLGTGFSIYGKDAIDAANNANVPPNVFLALIQSESSFNPNATHPNSNGTFDYGIAQLNSRYFPNASRMTIQEQLNAAAQHLASKYNGSWAGAITGYKGQGVSKSIVDSVTMLADKIGADPKYGAPAFDPNADTAAVMGASPFGAAFGAISPDGVSPSPAEVKGTTDATSAIGSSVIEFLKAAAIPIVIVVIAGAVLIFSVGGAFKGAPMNITVKAK